jgi:FkbM family methyltransferase
MGSELPHAVESVMLALTYPRAAYFRITESLDLRLSVRLETLRRAGMFQGITHILDAGANIGVYGSACARVLPSAEIICFEPVPSTFKVLAANTKRYSQIKPVNLALGSSRAELPMNVGSYHMANSLLKMNSNHVENWPGSAPSDIVMVPVVPLDEFLEKEGIKGNYLLKGDVQGYEMELLKGARQSLARCKILQLEVSLVPLYDGAPTFSEVWNHVTSAGFTLLDIADILHSPKDGTAASCDLIFVRG